MFVLGGVQKEDPPMTCKYLAAMVIVSPLTGVVGPLPYGRTLWLINGGDPITTYYPLVN